MRYFIAITLPEGLAKEIDKYRKQFYPRSLKMHPPHITLFPPFSPLSELTDLTAPLRRAAQNVQQFSLVTEGLGTFERRSNNVIFIKTSVNKPLQDLFEEVKTHLSPLIRKVALRDDFVAHITIGNRLSKKEFEKAKRHLVSYNPRFPFKVEDIVLFQKQRTDLKWEEADRIPLAT